MILRLLKRLQFFKMNVKSFSLESYNAVGLDLDHTISLYKLENVIKLQYKLLIDYLIKSGYDSNVFPSNLTSCEVNFIQRGLFLDFKKGNILKIAHDGTIVCGTHGTTKLSKNELMNIYGPNLKWDLTDQFVSDMISTWGPPVSDNMRSMMEFFDCQVPLVFGKAIDYTDQVNKQLNEYSVWPTILDGVISMFDSNGGFYEAIYEKPDFYLRKCSSKVIEWLENIKKSNKLLFLITGSQKEEASFLGSYCLGDDWKRHFDVIVYNAKKPKFFSQNRPFLETTANSFDESPLELTQGNWNELCSVISKKLSMKNPKCVYIGDHLIQDVYATSLTSGIDAVALIEEISEEDVFSHQEHFMKHPYADYLKSDFWGSYVFSGNDKNLTVWGTLMKTYSKFTIPSLDFLAEKPVDHKFHFSWPELN